MAFGLKTPATRLSLSPPEQGGSLTQDLFPAFRELEESQRPPPTSATSQVILIPNNQHAIVRYFGAACPGPPYIFPCIDLSALTEHFVRQKQNVSKKEERQLPFKTVPFQFSYFIYSFFSR